MHPELTCCAVVQFFSHISTTPPSSASSPTHNHVTCSSSHTIISHSSDNTSGSQHHTHLTYNISRLLFVPPTSMSHVFFCSTCRRLQAWSPVRQHPKTATARTATRTTAHRWPCTFLIVQMWFHALNLGDFSTMILS